MDKLMAFLHKFIRPITKLGGGKKFMVGSVPVHLWTLVALAIFIIGILIYHFGFAT